MRTELVYTHNKSIFLHGEWKAWVTKWFENPKFEGFESGFYNPHVSITNWEQIKDKLPKSYHPFKIIS